MIEEGERQVVGAGEQPQRQARELDGVGVEVDAAQARHGDVAARAERVVFGPRGEQVGREQVAGGEQEGAAAHRGVAEAQVEERLRGRPIAERGEARAQGRGDEPLRQRGRGVVRAGAATGAARLQVQRAGRERLRGVRAAMRAERGDQRREVTRRSQRGGIDGHGVVAAQPGGARVWLLGQERGEVDEAVVRAQGEARSGGADELDVEQRLVDRAEQGDGRGVVRSDGIGLEAAQRRERVRGRVVERGRVADEEREAPRIEQRPAAPRMDLIKVGEEGWPGRAGADDRVAGAF